MLAEANLVPGGVGETCPVAARLQHVPRGAVN